MTSKPARGSVIFTCSTFLSLPGKLDQLLAGLRSIVDHHPPEVLAMIDRFIVINETPDSKARVVDYATTLQRLFPWVEFVQKSPDAAGQAATLNLILQQLPSYEYWLHWEESWACHRPFIAQSLDIMQNTTLTQLQISADIWHYLEPSRLSEHTSALGERYADVALHPLMVAIADTLTLQTLPEIWNTGRSDLFWPLYSLRPSINRAAFYAELGSFSTDPQLWPLLFEWEYGMRWIRAGGKKGIMTPPPVLRQVGHQSTYTLPRE